MTKPKFTKREMSEIELALFYAMRCKHGTDGHGRLILISKMAQAIGIVMGEDGAMVVPSSVSVEEFELGPATARTDSAKLDEGYL